MVGASCAYFLSNEGFQVTLVERGGIANGTTSACQCNVGSGVGTESFLDFFVAGVETYRELIRQGFDFGYRVNGHLIVTETEAQLQRLVPIVDQLRVGGVAGEMLAPETWREVEPSLAPDLTGVARFPEGAQVSPMRVALELVQAAAERGATILTETNVVGIEVQGGRFRAVATSKGRIEADQLVIAAGAWSRLIGQMAGLHIPVWPLRGHVIVIEPTPGLLRQSIMDFSFEGTLGDGSGLAVDEEPARDQPIIGSVIQPLSAGECLIGGSRDYAAFDLGTSRETAGRIMRRAIRFVPGMARLRAVRVYAGLRPWTPDGRPLIGRCAGVEGLLLAIGPVGSITGGPITGRTIADILVSRSPRIDLGAVSPDRIGSALYGN